MSSIASISGIPQMPQINPALGLQPGQLGGARPSQGASGSNFGEFLGRVVDTVQTKQAEAQEATRAVIAGESDQIHASMIAMQESSVAFSLMVEVRNRLVESYQELMRMPV